MKANAKKCHFLINSNEDSNVCIDNNIIKNSKCEKLLAVKIYQTLNFNAHINNIGKKSGQNLSVLCKIVPYMGIQKRRLLLLNVHFMSQFNTALYTLRKKCQYSELFWSIFSPNAEKCRPK